MTINQDIHSDTELRSSYEKEKRYISLERLRIACWLGMILFPIFGLIDYFYVKENFIHVIAIRFYITYFSITILVLTYTKFGKKYSVFLNAISYITVGICFSAIVQHLGGYESIRYVGINLIMMTMGVLAPFGIEIASSVLIIMYLSYIIPIIIKGNIVNNEIFYSSNLYILSTAAIALSGVYASNKLHLKEFISRFKLRKAHTRLQDLNDLKSKFFTNISHEIKTPLSLIIAPIDVLLKRYSDKVTPEQLKYLNMIKENSFWLHQLIEDLLQISKIEEGKIEVSLIKTDFIKSLERLYKQFVSLAESKMIQYEFINLIDEVYMYYDIDKVEKIVTNLLSNAFKFTPMGGSITMKTIKDEDNKKIYVEITDTGIGIPEKDQSIIFDRFRQSELSLSRRYIGTGIGLSLAKELSQIHGGDINVMSIENKGTTFILSLPLIITHDERDKFLSNVKARIITGSITNESRSQEQLSKIKNENYDKDMSIDISTSEESISKSEKPIILIIDDNTQLLSLLKAELEREFRIITCTNGNDGMKLAQKYIPKLIITDIMMPLKNGYEVCKELKKNESTSNIPIIVLSAKRTDNDEILPLINEFINKPFDIDQLTSCIKKYI